MTDSDRTMLHMAATERDLLRARKKRISAAQAESEAFDNCRSSLEDLLYAERAYQQSLAEYGYANEDLRKAQKSERVLQENVEIEQRNANYLADKEAEKAKKEREKQ